MLVQAQSGHHLFRSFRSKQRFVAANGHNGQSSNKTGRGGDDLVIGVPVGTIVRSCVNGDDSRVLADLTELGVTAIAARGGSGGKGNARFSHSQNRVPVLAEDGEATADVTLELELQLLADVAIMGMPSVGKSSLLRACTRAHPEVAAYPFTTLEPVLGYVEGRDRDFVLVEIPGLLEGAHRGIGLGADFLRHAERVTAIVHLLDGTSEDPVADYLQIREEIRLHDEALAGKPEIVAVNKMDMPEAEARRTEIEACPESALGLRTQLHFSGRRGGHGGVAPAELEQMVSEQAAPEPAPTAPARSEAAARPRERATVQRDGDVFVLRSDRAERIVRRVNMDDWLVQVQLWGELRRMGAVRALERAGAPARGPP